MVRILVVDEGRRLGLREMLEPHGYQVAEAADGEEAMRLQDGDPADLVIADLAGLGNGERNPLRELMRKYPLLKVIAVSREGAAGFFDGLETSRSLGAVATITEPFSEHEVLFHVRACLGPLD